MGGRLSLAVWVLCETGASMTPFLWFCAGFGTCVVVEVVGLVLWFLVKFSPAQPDWLAPDGSVNPELVVYKEGEQRPL